MARFADELSFDKGDNIVVLQQPEGGWWEGEVGTSIGWFPCNHVEITSTQIATEEDRTSTEVLPSQMRASAEEVSLVISCNAIHACSTDY